MDMRIVLLAVWVAISPSLLVAQSSEAVGGKEGNLYALALEASITKMRNEWGHISGTDYHHVVVEKDPVTTDELPSRFGDSSVEYLDTNSLIERYKRVKKPFDVLRIFPIRNDADKLLVNISVYEFSYRKHRLLFGLSDWSNVEFRYDCEQRRFIATSVKLGGV